MTDGVIYLDRNTLGPLPKSATSLVQNVLEKEWGKTAHFGLE